MVRIITLIVLTGLALSPALGQVSTENALDLILEQLISSAEMEGESIDPELIIEMVNWYKDHPVDINHCSAAELSATLILSDAEAGDIIKYRDQFGQFLSLTELSAVPGISVVKAVLLSTMLSLEPVVRSPAPWLSYSILASAPLPADTELVAPAFPGKIRISINAGWKAWQASVILENDKGEDLFGGINPYGFDHMDFNLRRNGSGLVREVILGSYGLGFGNGRLLGTSYQVQASSGMRRSTPLVTAGSSGMSAETGRMRGFCIDLGQKNRGILAFASYAARDGKFDSLVPGFDFAVNNGYHTTASSHDQKDAISEKAIGLMGKWKHGDLELALLSSAWQHQSRDSSLAPGNSNWVLLKGLALNYSRRKLMFRLEGDLAGKDRWLLSSQCRLQASDQVRLQLNLDIRSHSAAGLYPWLQRQSMRDRGTIYIGTEIPISGDWKMMSGAIVKWREDVSVPGLNSMTHLFNLQFIKGTTGSYVRATWDFDDSSLRLSGKAAIDLQEGLTAKLSLSTSFVPFMGTPASSLVSIGLNSSGRRRAWQVQYILVRIPENGTALYSWASGIPGTAYTLGFHESSTMVNISAKPFRRFPLRLGIRMSRSFHPVWDAEGKILAADKPGLDITLRLDDRVSIKKRSN